MRLNCYELRRLRKWGNLDLNQRPTGYESAALTAELLPQEGGPGVQRRAS